MLDVDLIRRRRAELGLSQRALGAQLNATASLVRSLEAGTNHAELTVAQINRLATALEVELPSLFAPSSPTPAGPDTAADAATVGSILHATGVLTPVAALAEVLDWPHDRLRVALEGLAAALRTAGLRLHRLQNRVGITRAAEPADRDVLQAAVRRHFSRDNLNATEARLLARFITGAGAPREPSNAEAVALGVLVNAGLLVADPDPAPTRGTTWLLAPDVRDALLLDDAG